MSEDFEVELRTSTGEQQCPWLSNLAFLPPRVAHGYLGSSFSCLDAGSKRVKAPRPLPPPPAAAPLDRQLHGPRPSQRQQRSDSFSHFELHQEWDLYALDPPAAAWPPYFLRRRGAVREVVAAGGVVVALAGEAQPRNSAHVLPAGSRHVISIPCQHSFFLQTLACVLPSTKVRTGPGLRFACGRHLCDSTLRHQPGVRLIDAAVATCRERAASVLCQHGG